MIYYPRVKSRELLILGGLHDREHLNEKEKQHYLALEKGYAGEEQFDHSIETFPDNWLFINNLLLKENNSYFQIDSLGISPETLYLFDVKNFEGDYIVKGDKWESTKGTEITNPKHQLNRCETMLKKFLHIRGKQLPIKSYLIFINPQFTLYQAPLDSSIIFPTQLDSFFKNLKIGQKNLHANHYELADLFVSADEKSYPNSFIPAYEYEQLKKGLVCFQCKSLIVDKSTTERFGKITCKRCSYCENIELAILRAVDEYQILFPEQKLSTNIIYDWCNQLFSQKCIQRTLTKHFQRQGHGKYSYYIKG